MSQICLTCFEVIEENKFTEITEEIWNALIYCISEIKKDVWANPVICNECYFKILDYKFFKEKCLSTQKKIMILKLSCSSVIAPKKENEENFQTSFDDETEGNDVIVKNSSNNINKNSKKTPGKKKCKVCKKQFLDENKLQIHIKAMHVKSNKINNKSKTYKCEKCTFNTIERVHYIKHSKKCKGSTKTNILKPTIFDGNKLKCRVCNFRTRTVPSYVAHLNTHIKIPTEVSLNLDNIVEEFIKQINIKEREHVKSTCHVCNKDFKFLVQLFNHASRSKHPICELFYCKKCDIILDNIINIKFLKEHILWVHYDDDFTKTTEVQSVKELTEEVVNTTEKMEVIENGSIKEDIHEVNDKLLSETEQ